MFPLDEVLQPKRSSKGFGNTSRDATAVFLIPLIMSVAWYEGNSVLHLVSENNILNGCRASSLKD